MLLAMKTRNVFFCVSIRLLLVTLSVVQSFSRSKFCLISSISRLYGAGLTVDYDSVAFVLS